MKRQILLFCLILVVVLFTTCRKDYDLPTTTNKLEISGDLIDSLGYREVVIKTSISSLGGNKITQHGHCWGVNPMPDISGNHTQLGQLNSVGNFLSIINQLVPNTRYYFRSYFQTGNQTIYGSQVEGLTLKTGMPLVTTANAINVTPFSISCGGTVETDSGLAVTARGLCWDKDDNFSLSQCLGKSSNDAGTGSFTYTIQNLSENTPYFIKAYAINQVDTAYGNITEYTTLTLYYATVLTDHVVYYTASSAQLGGSVVSEGNGNITEKGVCWAINSTPTYEQNLGHQPLGEGLGPFTIQVYNLNSNQDYNVVAYAINEKGISYGAVESFKTKCDTPNVTTGYNWLITSTTLTMKSNIVIYQGGCNVDSRGVCWSNTNPLPTIQNCDGFLEDSGSGLGYFDIDVTNLSPGTIYWFRAFASNEDATGYGDTNRVQMQGPCESQNTMNIYHTIDGVAPVNKAVTYLLTETSLSGSPKCWITQNLGADHPAFSATDATEPSAGWYWQFNQTQGYKHTGLTRIPNTTWITTILQDNDWQLINDPCNLLLGDGWRIPTYNEWYNAYLTGGWNNYNDVFESVLKIHAAGYLFSPDGMLTNRGNLGVYWSSSQSDISHGIHLGFSSESCSFYLGPKVWGSSIRCLRD